MIRKQVVGRDMPLSLIIILVMLNVRTDTLRVSLLMEGNFVSTGIWGFIKNVLSGWEQKSPRKLYQQLEGKQPKYIRKNVCHHRFHQARDRVLIHKVVDN